jgi:hypothetical protein
VVDHLPDFQTRNACAELDRVPMLLVHVITGPHLFVAITQLKCEIGIAFQIYRRRNLIERGKCEHFAANLKHTTVSPNGIPSVVFSFVRQ